jgi:fatty acid/phospholipid biosynthesis enzyme
MNRPRIAVDAMGGDRAPEEIVAGAILAARECDAEIILTGDEARIRPLLTLAGATFRRSHLARARRKPRKDQRG